MTQPSLPQKRPSANADLGTSPPGPPDLLVLAAARCLGNTEDGHVLLIHARFPNLRILDPVQLLRELEPPARTAHRSYGVAGERVYGVLRISARPLGVTIFNWGARFRNCSASAVASETSLRIRASQVTRYSALDSMARLSMWSSLG